MEINCQFHYSLNRYECFVTEANITEKDHVIKEFRGIHLLGHCHHHVQVVLFNGTNVHYFLRGLEKHFPNLTHLQINGSGIKEISKNDLKGLEGLDGLWIKYCELTSLPDDLFTAMPNLRSVSFVGNKIEFASPELLKPLLGRENVKVCLGGNTRIDASYWPEYQDSLESLEELMELIDFSCIKPTVAHNPAEMSLSGKLSELQIIDVKRN